MAAMANPPPRRTRTYWEISIFPPGCGESGVTGLTLRWTWKVDLCRNEESYQHAAGSAKNQVQADNAAKAYIEEYAEKRRREIARREQIIRYDVPYPNDDELRASL